jgi:hypothetical protein
MTWIEFMHRYDPTISDEMAEFILWERTAFPCCDLRTTVRQLLSAIRARINNVEICDQCSLKIPYHSRGCPCVTK